MTTSCLNLNNIAHNIVKGFMGINPASMTPYYRSDSLIVLLESFNVRTTNNRDGSSSQESLRASTPTK